MRWETCRHNFCVIGAVVFGKLPQMTTKKSRCLTRENHGHSQKSYQEILKHNDKTQKENTVNKDWDKPQTIATLRSSDLRRHQPQCAPPPIGHAIRHVCVWTHCVWLSGLSAEEPGSSPPTKTPRPTGRHPLPPGGHGQESGCACRMWEREWDGWLVCAWVGVCKAGWERMQRREKIQKDPKRNNWKTQQ